MSFPWEEFYSFRFDRILFDLTQFYLLFINIINIIIY